MDSNEFGEFIKMVRDKVLSRPQMAEKTGLHINTIKGYEQEGRLPDVDYLAQLAIETGHSFADLLNKRLLAGRVGQVAKDKHLLVAERISDYQVSVKPARNLPRLPVLNQDKSVFIDDELLPAGLDLSHLIVLQVDEPLRRYLVVDPEDKALQDGQTFILDYGTGLVARKIQFGIAGAIMLIAEGQAAAPLTVPDEQRDQIKLIGRVVCSINHS
ncbi:XRE family transcriptional regulator [Alkalimonas mucilaginosa]|uniref:Helix-turn-helix transcriptional regulator n=1 Tax=Alkalimonas mucilaginosa TaxID=3057676 RepID=A0ABU7JH99_9GAMM|nr:helix-turn-helix transcriptional regulator [Alkalimonas sp. MEB004]MEE2025064.1 helix-turn-helix transcriptional regulator [Alkalimonas sp. MEB004]